MTRSPEPLIDFVAYFFICPFTWFSPRIFGVPTKYAILVECAAATRSPWLKHSKILFLTHITVHWTMWGRMSLPAITLAPRLFPPYDSAPFQVLSAPSIQAAGTERGCGGRHGPFPGPRSGSHTPLQGFSHVDPQYCKGGWETSPGSPRKEG